MENQERTRRQALQRAGAVIVGAAALAASPMTFASRAYAASRGNLAGALMGADAASGQQYWNFVSRPDLQPPIVTVTTDAAVPELGPRYIFAIPHEFPQQAPGAGQPQPGRLIMDWEGQPVWFSPAMSPHENLSVQCYQGKPVLVWWEGQGTVVGGQFMLSGVCKIADSSYTPIATVAAVGDGYSADMHECLLTPRGTAYISVEKTVTADLTPLGGPASGQMVNSVIQEIDVATGDLLFQWEALEHVPLDESHWPYSPATLTDPYHLNSITIDQDGDLLVSLRHTWTIYKVSRATGAVVWRLGGSKSDFTMGPGASFAWQHDAKLQVNGFLSIFDNESFSPTVTQAPQSRGIFLHLDTSAMRASLVKQYTRPGGTLAHSQGDVQLLEGERVFVGWGDQPYFSLFSPDGQLLTDAQLPILGGPADVVFQSYRILSADWVGKPTEPPAAAVRPGASGGAVVYASWNGATEVARWVVLAGKTASSLGTAGARRRAGFETTIPVGNLGPYFVAVAVDAHGNELGRSYPVTLSTS